MCGERESSSLHLPLSSLTALLTAVLTVLLTVLTVPLAAPLAALPPPSSPPSPPQHLVSMVLEAHPLYSDPAAALSSFSTAVQQRTSGRGSAGPQAAPKSPKRTASSDAWRRALVLAMLPEALQHHSAGTVHEPLLCSGDLKRFNEQSGLDILTSEAVGGHEAHCRSRLREVPQSAMSRAQPCPHVYRIVADL